MRNTPLVLVAMLLASFSNLPCFGADVVGTRTPYDGEWSVDLVCDDTQDKNGLVKGYEYKFPVSIADGKLQGQYGASGAPASVVYSGIVANDGALELKAVGNTGRSAYSVGKVAQGTGYSYTMTGKLEQKTGQAVRREVIACTATFSRL